jgi:hypothetical protein
MIHQLRTRWLRRWSLLAPLAAVILVGLGVTVGAAWTGTTNTGSRAGSNASHEALGYTKASARPTGAQTAGSVASNASSVVDMRQAKGELCQPPVAPGPGHPKRLVYELFNVNVGRNTQYLLGWQIVPWHGVGTYNFATSGNLLAIEPATGGRPLGYGQGTVQFKDDAQAGTVAAVVPLKSGGALRVSGPWTCSSGG